MSKSDRVMERANLIAAWNEQCRLWKVECARLRRANDRLRAWVTYWRFELKDYRPVEDIDLHRASRGDAPPRKRARKGGRR